jgi:thiol:disulfide interchange protein DsbD
MDLRRISTGSPKKPSRPDAAAVRKRVVLAVSAVLATVVAGGAGAQGKLLEPERAFAFSVQALDDRTVEARFAIADGYYLYRDKLKFSVEPAPIAGVPMLPPGKVKHDEFFGTVETYRGRLAVKLPLDAPQPNQQVTVRAESQGCADAGVCYPPQIQSVSLTLPAPGARPGAPVFAVPPKKSWFN